jgi:hypothetical protein
MRKIPFALIRSGYSLPPNQELTMRKALITVIWFAASASLTFVIVYLFTIAPMSSRNASTPASSDRTLYPSSESY